MKVLKAKFLSEKGESLLARLPCLILRGASPLIMYAPQDTTVAIYMLRGFIGSKTSKKFYFS